MQIRALRTFGGQYGVIRTGIVLTVDDRYGGRLIANGLAEQIVMEPPLNMAHTEAPYNKGKEFRTPSSERVRRKKSGKLSGQQAAGVRSHRLTVSSLPVVPPSRFKT